MIVDSFLAEILDGIHQSGDEYRVALYVPGTKLNPRTSVRYTTVGEVGESYRDERGDMQSTGYKAGGQILTGRRLVRDGSVSFLDWDSPVWSRVSISAREVMIFNATRENRAVSVFEMDRTFISTNGDFIVELPEPTAKTAVVRIGRM